MSFQRKSLWLPWSQTPRSNASNIISKGFLSSQSPADASQPPYDEVLEVAHARVHTALVINGCNPKILERDLQKYQLTPSMNSEQRKQHAIIFRMLDILRGRAPPPEEPTIHQLASRRYAMEMSQSSDPDSVVEAQYCIRLDKICRQGKKDGVEFEILAIMSDLFLADKNYRKAHNMIRAAGRESQMVRDRACSSIYKKLFVEDPALKVSDWEVDLKQQRERFAGLGEEWERAVESTDAILRELEVLRQNGGFDDDFFAHYGPVCG